MFRWSTWCVSPGLSEDVGGAQFGVRDKRGYIQGVCDACGFQYVSGKGVLKVIVAMGISAAVAALGSEVILGVRTSLPVQCGSGSQ